MNHLKQRGKAKPTCSKLLSHGVNQFSVTEELYIKNKLESDVQENVLVDQLRSLINKYNQKSRYQALLYTD